MWLCEKFSVWLEEKALWSTDKKAAIPSWAIKNKAMVAKIRNDKVTEMQSKRRKSSLINAILL